MSRVKFPSERHWSALGQKREKSLEHARALNLRSCYVYDPNHQWPRVARSLGRAGIEVRGVMTGEQGSSLEGSVPIVGVSQLLRAPRYPVLMLLPSSRMRIFLEKLGLTTITYTQISALYSRWPVIYPVLALDVLRDHLAAQRKIFDRLQDDKSRETFLRCLRFAWTWDDSHLPNPDSGIYFDRDLVNRADLARFVDCGAYTGTTLRSLLKQKRRGIEFYWGFEPDPANFAVFRRLADLRRSSRFRASPAAIGGSSGQVRFLARNSHDSRISSRGQIVVSKVRLDDYPFEKAPTMIKMDIEGQEIAALKGARNLLRDHSPLLAISSYHRAEDLWQIPMNIEKLNPDYQFAFRHYSHTFFDTICYGLPKRRG